MNRWVWLSTVAVFSLFIYLTHEVMLPFLAGLAVAYFLDPLADKLEARKVPRGAAAALVLTLFFLTVTGIILAFWPILQAQLGALATTVPKTLANLRPWLIDTIQSLSTQFGVTLESDLDTMLGSFSEEILAKAQAAAGGVLRSGFALFNILTLMLITPVVAFYLLRDWDLLVAKVDSWLPPAKAPVVRAQMAKVDDVLAGFVRGQLLVSTTMGVLYAIGWTLTGLEFAIVLGVLAGIMSFVPFVGALFAALIAVAVGLGQWGFDLTNIALVASVFVVVQAIEGAFLTPRLVGERVGLHPVWVLFAVFAGGEVMGFVGVLIAVPATAALAVLVRYWIDVYLEHYDIAPEPAPKVEMPKVDSGDSVGEKGAQSDQGKTDTA